MRKSLISFIAMVCAISGGGCHVLQYQSATGERFTRAVLGVNTSLAALVLESDTNGVHRVELRGYASESSQALGTVTEAAVRAAVQSAAPH
jgi:hypothetical protein